MNHALPTTDPASGAKATGWETAPELAGVARIVAAFAAASSGEPGMDGDIRATRAATTPVSLFPGRNLSFDPIRTRFAAVAPVVHFTAASKSRSLVRWLRVAQLTGVGRSRLPVFQTHHH